MAAGKAKGGKGKGQHVARKNKYARGAAGSSVKGKNKKKTGGAVTMKNAAKRAQRHTKLMGKQQARSADREEMLSKVVEKFKGTPLAKIKKRFGTLNIRRMTDILSDTFEQSEWYLARYARRQAAAERARVVRKHVKFRKRSKAEKKELAKSNQRQAIQDVSSGSDD